MGWCRACRVRTSASVVSVCTRRRGGSYGLLYVCCAGTGELPHRSTYVVGHENASVREGGRRQRRSQTPRCNDGDTVKVCQAWCTETASYTNGTALREKPCEIEGFGYEPLRHSLPEVLGILLTSDESVDG